MMELQKLYELLCSGWNEQEQTLLIKGSEIPNPIGKLLCDHFTDGRVFIEQVAKPIIEDNLIKITQGVLREFYNLHDQNVSGEFWIDEQLSLQCRFKVIIDEPVFKLSKAFQIIKDEPIDNFEYENATFILESIQAEEEQRNITLQKQYANYFYDSKYESELIQGLHFQGKIRIPELLQWITVFLSEGNFTVSSSVDILDGIPRFSLTTAKFKAIQLGELSVPLCLQIISLFKVVDDEDRRQVSSTTLYRFTAEVEYNYGEGVLDLPLHADFFGPSPEIVILEADTKDLSQLALDQFSKLLGNIPVSQWIPKDFPVLDAVILAELGLVVSLTNLKILEINSTFALNDKYLDYQLIPELLNITNITIPLSVTFPSEGMSLQVNAFMDGIAHFSGAEVTGDLLVHISALPDVAFNIELSHGGTVRLTKILEELIGQSLYLPDIDCVSLNLSGQRSPAEFTFQASLSSDITIPVLNMQMEELGLYFKYTNQSSQNTNALDTIRLFGKLSLYDRFQVLLEAELKAKGWRFEGSFEATDSKPLTLNDFLPPEIQLPEEFVMIGVKSGHIIVDTEVKSVEIKIETDSYIAFGELGRIESSSFKLYFEEQKDATCKWLISSHGALKLLETNESDTKKNYLLDIAGTLEIKGQKDQFGIQFKADEGSGEIKGIPLPVPYQIETGSVQWSEMLFRIEKLILEKKDKWHFESDFQLKFTKIPEFIESILSKGGLHVGLMIDGTEELKLSLKESILEFVIPNIQTPAIGDLESFNLGTAKVALNNLTLKLQKKLVALEVEVDCYLPSRLNYLFGEDEQHKPKVILFKTYEPDQPETSECLAMKFAGEIGSDKSDATVSISKIPIAFIEDKDKYWRISLGTDGKYGALQIEKPTLGLDVKKGGFSAKGGFIIEKDPAIPLDLLKEVLKNAKLENISNILPAELPIPVSNPPKFIEDGTLYVERINEYFGNLLPAPVVDILNTVASVVNKLPKAFVEYMDLKVPAEFHFELVLTPDGGVDISLLSDPGLKMLLITPPTPMITGITLRQFSFGEMLAGQLFKVRIDADIDIFDIESMLASLVVDKELYKYFGNPREYHYRIQIHKLLTIIFYQAGFPIPIPLFFDKLGIDYYGIGDNTLQSSFSFKEPGLNLQEIGSILTDLVKFFTDPKFALDPNKVYKDFNLQFDIGPNFIQTGQLLGSQTLGLKDGLQLPSAYQLVAYLLDGIKFFDFMKYIKSIPVKYRFGSGQYISGFVCISMSADWIISTPDEFIKENGYKYINIDDTKAKKFLEILPREDESRPITENDEGLIIFLRGTWETNFSSLDTAFGLIMLKAKKFNIGFYLTGSVANLYNIDMMATVKINPPDIPFELYGKNKTNFFIPGLTFFTGETTISADMKQFEIDGTFTLLDVQNLIYFRTPKKVGGILSKEKISLSGGIEAGFLIFTGSGNISISNLGISAALTIMGRETSFNFGMINSNTLQIGGIIPVGWTDYSMCLQITPIKNRLYLDLKSSTFAGLMALEMIFNTAMDATKFGTRGEFRLYILEVINPNPILSGSLTIDNTGFEANGHFKLLPDGFPFNLEGSLIGSIMPTGFRFSGSINLTVVDQGAFGGDITITESGISGHFTILGVGYTYGVRIWNNVLYIYGTYSVAGKDYPFYIDNQFPFLHLANPPFATNEFICLADAVTDECAYPLATELLLTAYSKMIEIQGSELHVNKDDKFECQILDLYNLTIEINPFESIESYRFTVKRLTDGEDFFTELRDAVQQSLQKKEIVHKLELTDVTIILEYDGVDEKVIITLPHDNNPGLQRIEAEFCNDNPGILYQSVVAKVFRVLRESGE